MKKNNNKKVSVLDVIRKIIFLIALIVFIFSGYKLFVIWKGYHDNKKAYDKVEQYAPEKVKSEDGEDLYKFTPEDFSKLYAVNNDLKGWIYVPKTEVNYPIVQTKDNDYYLHHNFYKEANSGGCIFIASEYKNPFNEQNTTIHGHHMKDGSMFASLKNFEEEEFFKKNKIVYITTKTEVLKYEVFSVYVQEANNDPYLTDFTDDNDYIKYLNGLKEKSMYQREGMTDFTANDRIITLSTCNYEVNNGRLLVHARLVKEIK